MLFITPYIEKGYGKLELADLYYDGVIYTPIENVPRRFAILKGNEWIVEESALVIAYVKHSWGGAAKTLEYAKRKEVSICNFAELS